MKKILCWVFVIAFMLSLTACEKMDTSSSTATADEDKAMVNPDTNEPIKIPVIKSDDEKMPTYFDISLYDEENYSDIYLGKKYKYEATYSGEEISFPSNYNKMIDAGWVVEGSSDYDQDTQVLTGKSITVDFKNRYHKKMTVVFYNDKDSSASLKDCKIVKYIVKENVLNNKKSDYGQFFINGVSNESAITDIIEFLGAPSHFYCVDGDSKYYFDWFLTAADKRSGITIYVDIEEDTIDSIEISYY